MHPSYCSPCGATRLRFCHNFCLMAFTLNPQKYAPKALRKRTPAHQKWWSLRCPGSPFAGGSLRLVITAIKNCSNIPALIQPTSYATTEKIKKPSRWPSYTPCHFNQLGQAINPLGHLLPCVDVK